MALELFFETKCTADSEDFAQRIRNFTALMPVRNQLPAIFKTVSHSKDQGLINFDFSKDGIERLLTKDAIGLRITPALDKFGELTVVITAYKEDLNEVYMDGKLLADCCPQPPPPYNTTSTLYHDLYDNLTDQAPLIV